MTNHHRNVRCSELMKNNEECHIIWLDANIDDSDDLNKTQTMLLELNLAAKFYIDPIQCIDALKSIKDKQILFIISGSLARNVLPEIHHIQSIVAIFIFCANREYHAWLMNKYDKIVNIFIDQNNLLRSIHETLDLLEKQAMTFSLFDRKQKTTRDLSKESASFLWHQLIIYVLKQMPKDEQSKQDLLDKCQKYHQFNKVQLQKINKFREDYRHGQAIEWYTDECFLYKLLNQVLRIEDIDLIYSFRFFIIDLCSEIEQEHRKLKTNNIFKTYRGQKIPTEELDKLKNNKGEIVSINGFLSTSRDINVSLNFARCSIISHDIHDTQSVLFEIDVDPSVKTAIYADISHKSHHEYEQEILFNLNSLFKIMSVDFDATDNIYKIHLKTTDESVRDVQEHLQYIQKEIDECSPIIYFGWLLLNELGQVDQAKKYFMMLTETLSSDDENFDAAFNGIGCVYSKRNEWNLALKNYEIAYKIRQKRLPPDHSRIAASLHNIAGILETKGDFNGALERYEKALKIEENNHPDDCLQKAVIIQNIGNTFTKKRDLDAALEYLFNALDMFRGILPKKHPKISTCLGDIGFAYKNKGDFKTALDYYRQALEMDEDCLPPDHPHLSEDFTNIAITYMENHEEQKALKLCHEKLTLLQNTSGNNHTRIAQTLITVAKVLENKKKFFNEALQYYNDALDNLEKSVPRDQREIAKCLHCKGHLYFKSEKFDDALVNLLKAWDLYCQFLSLEHIDIAAVCEMIGICYQKTDKSAKALEFFNISLSSYRANYESDHEKVKLLEKDITKINREQYTTPTSIELIEENVNNEQQTPTNSAKPVKENINDEQLITVVIDYNARPSIIEPSPVVDSASTPKLNQNDKESETKTSVKKLKICPNCEIL